MATRNPSSFLLPRWPTPRTLGAMFAGSAVMFSAAVIQGGTLLVAGEGAQAATAQADEAAGGPSAAGTTNSSIGKAAAMPVTAAAQAAPWAPGTAADWRTPLSQLPLHRAPVQTTPQGFFSASPAASASAPGTDTDAATPDRGGAEHSGEEPDGTVLGNVLGYVVPGGH